MTDSVATISTKLDESEMQSDIQTWLTNNSSVTSVDDTEIVRVGSNRAIVTIMYTA